MKRRALNETIAAEFTSKNCVLRKLWLCLFVMMIVIWLSCGSVFADFIEVKTEMAGGSGITSEEINEGVGITKTFPTYLQWEGNTITTETPPVIIRGRVLIPARALIEAMGGSVSWNDAARTVTVIVNGVNCVLTVDSNMALVNGETKTLDVPALIIDSDGDGAGSTMVPVRFVAEALNYTPLWNEETRIVNVVAVAPQNPVDNGAVAGNPSFNNNSSSANTSDGTNSSDPNAAGTAGITAEGLPKLDSRLAGKVIVIDAGHGGSDPGKTKDNNGTQVLEKDFNLSVALKLNEYLKSAGASTYMTRESDVAVALQERPKRANEAYGHVFVSVHHNSFGNASVGGTETYYYLKDSEKDYGIDSKTLAESVQKEVVGALNLRDRGAKSEPEYAVLNKTKMPAILVEIAYLTNPDELKLIMTDEYKQKAAYAIAKGMINALNASVK